jgi:threonine/homoserine/homoserine lactone efflux protein
VTPDTLAALAGFAFAASWTPGPNNALLAASGANFGLRRTLPHILGVTLGFGLMVVLVAFGIGRALADAPDLQRAMAWAGAAFLLWMAWKIAMTDTRPEVAEGARPFGFLTAAAFQWINPKGWMICIGVATQFAGSATGIGPAAVLGLVFVAAGITSSFAWAGLGAAMQRLVGTPARLRAFNLGMGLLLAATVVWMLL